MVGAGALKIRGEGEVRLGGNRIRASDARLHGSKRATARSGLRLSTARITLPVTAARLLPGRVSRSVSASRRKCPRGRHPLGPPASALDKTNVARGL